MEDLRFILEILKVKEATLSDLEKNALLLYVVPRERILNKGIVFNDNIKMGRLIDTLAYIMGSKVEYLPKEADKEVVAKAQIKAMGWQDDFVDERVKHFSKNGGFSWWEYKLPSQWAIDWLSSLYSEYRYKVITCT